MGAGGCWTYTRMGELVEVVEEAEAETEVEAPLQAQAGATAAGEVRASGCHCRGRRGSSRPGSCMRTTALPSASAW